MKEMKLECHLKWFSLSSTVEGLGEEVELSNTRPAYLSHTLRIFSGTLSDSTRPEKIAMEISINVFTRSTSF